MKNLINSNSQMHGKAFENMLKAVFNASDTQRSNTCKFDIEAKFNKEQNTPVSIKTIKQGTKSICMSDARRFFENEESFVMLVGVYVQKDKRKVFEHIVEYNITNEALKKIKGELTLQDVQDFHMEIKNFAYGYHIEARDFAKQKLKQLKNKQTSIILNPKIDSHSQRRLQCSLPVDKLEKILGKENIKVHNENFGFLTLPIVIFSEERKISMKETPEIKAAKALDQFYTKPELAKQYVKEVGNYIANENMNVDLFVEPSAGGGAFTKAVKNEFPEHKLIAYDIDPQLDDIEKKDFLEKDITEFENKRVVVVGNPPFGKNSSLAIKFFNKSADFANIIAFVLPKTFKKSSVVNKLNDNFHLVKEVEVPYNSFLVLGNEIDVPCVFQLWQRKEFKREKIISDSVCEDYSFSDRNNAQWAFQRVGVKAGALKGKDKFVDIADASHVFMNFTQEENAIIFSLIDWKEVKYNTAGNPSISKTEMKQEYLKTKEQHIDFMKNFSLDKSVLNAAIFKDKEEGVHVRIIENGVMQKLPVRKLFEEESEVAYSLTYNCQTYPFIVKK